MRRERESWLHRGNRLGKRDANSVKNAGHKRASLKQYLALFSVEDLGGKSRRGSEALCMRRGSKRRKERRGGLQRVGERENRLPGPRPILSPGHRLRAPLLEAESRRPESVSHCRPTDDPCDTAIRLIVPPGCCCPITCAIKSGAKDTCETPLTTAFARRSSIPFRQFRRRKTHLLTPRFSSPRV